MEKKGKTRLLLGNITKSLSSVDSALHMQNERAIMESIERRPVF